MLDYEYLFSTSLHNKLKQKIIGGINVYITEYDELCVKIIRSKDLGFDFTYLSDGSFSNMLLKGYSVDEACNDVINSYRKWILWKCFK